MGIYIKGMEMPKSCCECKIKQWDDEDDFCLFTGVICLGIGRQAKCPLVEISTVDEQPVRHGHWIDKSSEQEKKGLFGIMSSVIKYRIVQCDQCGNMLDLDGVNAGRGDANFCPNCGAKMDNGS